MLPQMRTPEYRTEREAKKREYRANSVEFMDALREAGYIVRLNPVTWGPISEDVLVACTDGCGAWVAPCFGLPDPTLCQPCLNDRMNQAGV